MLQNFAKKVKNDVKTSILGKKKSRQEGLRQLHLQYTCQMGLFPNDFNKRSRAQRMMTTDNLATILQTPLLLLGKGASEKQGLTKILHKQYCASGPFVSVDCSEIELQNLEGILYGWLDHTRTSGARASHGVLEKARGGTLLIKRVDTIPLYLQARLARAVHQKSYRRLGDNMDIRLEKVQLIFTSESLEELHPQFPSLTTPMYWQQGYIDFIWKPFCQTLALVAQHAKETIPALQKEMEAVLFD